MTRSLTSSLDHVYVSWAMWLPIARLTPARRTSWFQYWMLGGLGFAGAMNTTGTPLPAPVTQR